MKKIVKKISSIIATLAVFTGAFCALFPTNTRVAEAGVSNKTLINKDTLFSENAINTRDFIIGSGIEAVTEGTEKTIRFSPMMDVYDVLLLNTYPEVTELQEGPTVIANATFTLTEIKGDKQFGVMFGISRLNATPKYAESAWLYFELNESKDGYVYGLNVYDEMEQETVLIGKTALADGTDITVSFEQFYDGDLAIVVDGGEEKTFENVSIGHVGFGQTGAYTDANNYVDVTLKEFEVKNRFEVFPQNTNIVLDGSEGHLNAEEVFVRGAVLCNEDGTFSFYNAGHTSCIVTKYQYSNFSLEFDIVDMQRLPEFKANGDLAKTASQYFAIAFGLDTDNPKAIKTYQDAMNYKNSCWTQITGDVYADPDAPSVQTRISYGDFFNRKGGYLPEQYHLWNPHFDGRTANIRITVVDSVYTLDVKWADEEAYYTAFTTDLGFMPVGHIVFSGGTSTEVQVTNVTFDNFRITNLDRKPNLIEVGYKPTGIENKGDYQWTDTRNPSFMLDYELSDNAKEQEFPMIQAVIAGVCLVTAVGFVIACFVVGKE